MTKDRLAALQAVSVHVQHLHQFHLLILLLTTKTRLKTYKNEM